MSSKSPLSALESLSRSSSKQTKKKYILPAIVGIVVVYLLVLAGTAESNEQLVSAVSFVATVCTIAMFLSPAPTVMHGKQTNSVEKLSDKVYLSTILNCGIWFVYGYLSANQTVMVVNGSGVLCGFFFLFTFYSISRAQQVHHIKIIFLVKYVVPYIILLFLFSLLAADIVGTLAVAANIIMYGSPLSKMASVLKTRDPTFIPAAIAWATLFCSSLWTWFGSLIGDYYIVFPNVCGIVLALLQLALIGWAMHLYELPLVRSTVRYTPVSTTEEGEQDQELATNV